MGLTEARDLAFGFASDSACDSASDSASDSDSDSASAFNFGWCMSNRTQVSSFVLKTQVHTDGAEPQNTDASSVDEVMSCSQACVPLESSCFGKGGVIRVSRKISFPVLTSPGH